MPSADKQLPPKYWHDLSTLEHRYEVCLDPLAAPHHLRFRTLIVCASAHFIILPLQLSIKQWSRLCVWMAV
ncbi:hypothetical protein Y032_0001g51 [Ancylostoma ceylanicum]|uniref:Uncharacterized protein n=1 Tax=Ancylostoma ceylanicum TaxID=53326 RepID=A0A016W5S2_9BILA|nr:hypothetical protein Y032_0001g51 [Ancylostoma ceylanicum]